VYQVYIRLDLVSEGCPPHSSREQQMSSHPSGRVIPASKFTVVQHKQLARVFQLIDVDHDGLLSEAEARTMFVAASVAPTAQLLEYVV
jgi:Ca2+-binding EF-hand superfamily protein